MPLHLTRSVSLPHLAVAPTSDVPFPERQRSSRESAWYCTLMVPDDLMGAAWDVSLLSGRFTDHMKSNAKLLCVTRDDPDVSVNRPHQPHVWAPYAHPSMWDRYGGQHRWRLPDVGRKRLTDLWNWPHGPRRIVRRASGLCGSAGHRVGGLTLWGRHSQDHGETSCSTQHQRDHARLYFSKASDWAPS